MSQATFDLPSIAKGKTRRKVKGLALRPIPAPAFYRMELRTGMQRIINVWIEGNSKILSVVRSSTLTQDDEIDDVTSILEDLARRAEIILVNLSASLPILVGRVERVHAEKWTGSVIRDLGIDISPLIRPLRDHPLIKAHLKWALDLLKDFSEENKKRVASIVNVGVTTRKPAREIGRELAKALNLSRRRADLIASDQANKLSGALDQLRHEEAGVKKYRWRHSGKVNFRPEHKDREGQIFSWDKPPSDGHPKSQPYCGCHAQPWIPLLDEIEGEADDNT